MQICKIVISDTSLALIGNPPPAALQVKPLKAKATGDNQERKTVEVSWGPHYLLPKHNHEE